MKKPPARPPRHQVRPRDAADVRLAQELFDLVNLEVQAAADEQVTARYLGVGVCALRYRR